MKRSALAIGACVVIGSLVAAVYATGVFGSSAPNQTSYLSPTGSDSNSCTAASPCLTFARAYQSTLPGGSVLVGCGAATGCSYPSQVMPYTIARSGDFTCRAAATFPDGQTTTADTSGCVTFLPAPGATPTIASVAVEVPYVQLSGLAFTGTVFAGANIGRTNAPCTAWKVHDVVLSGVTAPSVTVNDASYLYVVRSSFGPLLDQASHVTGCKDSAGRYAQGSHLVIDGATFHDYRQTQQGSHMECIHFQGSDDSVIQNSRFLNCGQQDLSFQTNVGVSSIKGLLVQNNILDAACSHPQPGDKCGVVSGGTTTFICDGTGETLANVVVRFNTLNGTPSFQRQGGCSMSAITVSGNILAGPAFDSACNNARAVGVTYAFNAFTNPKGVTCGPGNVFGAAPDATWVDPSSYDYRLKRSSRAIDVVPVQGQVLPRDQIGVPRPLRGRADAGSLQWEAPSLVLGRSIGSIRLGAREADVVQAYGPPRSTSTILVGKRRLRRLSYVLHQGSLWALVDGTKVVGVGTTSGFYSTRSGVGAGATVSQVLPRSEWSSCRTAFRRKVGPAAVYFGPAGGKRGKQVASVFMLLRAYAPC